MIWMWRLTWWPVYKTTRLNVWVPLAQVPARNGICTFSPQVPRQDADPQEIPGIPHPSTPFLEVSMKITSVPSPVLPPKPEPELSYEEARMAAGMAIQKAVGQLKERFPVKSIQERTLKEMERADDTPASEEDAQGDDTAQAATPVSPAVDIVA